MLIGAARALVDAEQRRKRGRIVRNELALTGKHLVWQEAADG